MQSWHEGAEAIIEIMIARISKEYPSAKTMTMEAAIELFGELANHARIGLKVRAISEVRRKSSQARIAERFQVNC
jgi:hypothetical protein